MAGRIGLGFLKGGGTSVPSGVIIAWPSTNASIPTGWTRTTSLDGRFVKQIANSSTDPGTTGGAASHSHAGGGGHSHSVLNHTHNSPTTTGSLVHTTNFVQGRASGSTNNFQSDDSGASHSHNLSISAAGAYSTGSATPTYASTSTEPPNLVVIFIQSNGTPIGIPNNALAYYNSSAPTGWSQYTTGNSRLLKGASTNGDGGGTGGTGNSHTHTLNSHSHSQTPPAHSHSYSTSAVTMTTVTGIGANGINIVASTQHTHQSSSSDTQTNSSGTSGGNTDTSASADMTPPWYKLLLIQNTGSAVLPTSIICLWTGTLASIPLKWHLCDGTSGTPNLSQGKYIMDSDTIGNIGTTGGASSHTHGSSSGHSHANGAGSHSHTASQTSGFFNETELEPNQGGSNHNFIADQNQVIATHSIAASDTQGDGSISNASEPTSGSDSTEPTYTAVAYIQYTG